MDYESIKVKLQEPLDREAIMIIYKQIHKYMAKISTKMDVVEWFHKRIETVFDINHLMQIDDVLLSLIQ